MKRQDELLDRLAACARRETAPLAGEVEIPFGFASRVIALAIAKQAKADTFAWQQLALRAIPVATAVLLICWLALPQSHAGSGRDTDESLASAIVEEALSR